MEEQSWRRNHGGGIVEEESWRMNHGGCIMEEASWRRLPGAGSRSAVSRALGYQYKKKKTIHINEYAIHIN